MPDDDIASLRAHAHPVRLRILSLLTGSSMSAAEVARELGLTHANASYHLRVLAAAGEVVEAGEVQIRGGRAKRYRHPWQRGLETNATSSTPEAQAETAEAMVAAMAQELVRRAGLREPGTRSWLTDADLWVPVETWTQVTGLLQEASRLVHAEARPPRSPETVHVNLTAALFQMRP